MRYFLLLIISINLFSQKLDLFLLKTYKDDQNVTGWYMSEKLDGVRAFWDGEKLISRGGNIFNAPAFFTEGFPDHKLDGELWSKRGEFDRISSIVRVGMLDPRVKPEDDSSVISSLTGNLSDDDSSVIPSLTGNLSDDDSSVIPDSDRESNWTKLTYNIFEVPDTDGNLTQRLEKVKETKYLKLIKQIKVKNKTHLKNFQKEIEDKGGEGVVVRDASLPYYTGRNDNALKVKSFLDDECTVTQHLDGSGKYKNKLGSIKCKLKSGKIIKIGTGFSDKQRQSPPALGSVVTFKYYGLTSKGNPRFPVFLRERR
jgi:DNA ligase-1